MEDTTLRVWGLIIQLLTPIIPVLILILGGQSLINKYHIKKKEQELRLDLVCSIRKQQYQTLQNLYSTFAEFMKLYRLTDELSKKELGTKEIKDEIIKMSINAETKIDALILEIGCEFPPLKIDEIDTKYLLGNLRQSVQLWRESFINENHLPFDSSGQKDYMRFKSAFALVSSFMINRIYGDITDHKISVSQVSDILVDAFDNKHEFWNVGELKINRFKEYISDQSVFQNKK